MKFITEEQIDRIAQELETSEDAFARSMEDLQTQHPVIFSYLLTENFEVLAATEKDYMFFLLAILWGAIKNEPPAGTPIRGKALGEAEERNWALIQGSKAKNFQERLNVFFENYPQEDLLAFVEDALADEEDGLLTREGREPIFITLKSILDCWVL